MLKLEFYVEKNWARKKYRRLRPLYVSNLYLFFKKYKHHAKYDKIWCSSLALHEAKKYFIYFDPKFTFSIRTKLRFTSLYIEKIRIFSQNKCAWNKKIVTPFKSS